MAHGSGAYMAILDVTNRFNKGYQPLSDQTDCHLIIKRNDSYARNALQALQEFNETRII